MEIPTYPDEWSEADIRRLIFDARDVVKMLAQRGMVQESFVVSELLKLYEQTRSGARFT